MNAVASVSSTCKRKQVDFQALLEAVARRSDYFGPLGPQGAFEIYRWMAQTVLRKSGYPFVWPTRWGHGSLIANLGGLHSCTSVTLPNPIGREWRRQLFERFAHALLDVGPMADWRGRLRINFQHPRSVAMLYEEPIGYDLARTLDRLFALATPTRRLTVALNKHHPDARYLTDVLLSVNERGWAASIKYGYEGARWSTDSRTDPADDDSEDACHTQQQADETFCAFVTRTHAKFEALLTPVCAHHRWSCQPTRNEFYTSPFRPHSFGARCELSQDI